MRVEESSPGGGVFSEQLWKCVTEPLWYKKRVGGGESWKLARPATAV